MPANGLCQPPLMTARLLTGNVPMCHRVKMRPRQRSAERSARQQRCRQYGRESRQDSILSRTCPAQPALGEPTNRLGLGQYDGRSVGLTSA